MQQINLFNILVLTRCHNPRELRTILKLNLDQDFTVVPRVLTDVREGCDLLKTLINS